MLLYLDAKGLLSLGQEQALAPDLRTLEAVALAVRSGKTDLGTELNITVGQPQQAETEPAPLPPAGG